MIAIESLLVVFGLVCVNVCDISYVVCIVDNVVKSFARYGLVIDVYWLSDSAYHNIFDLTIPNLSVSLGH